MDERRRRRPLWTCPECGQSLVTANMWHSCVRLTEGDVFRGRETQRALYDAWLAFVRRFGPLTVNVSRTRISFQARVRFAGMVRMTRDGIVCGFWLKRRIESPRFIRVEHLPPGDFVYQFKLNAAEQLDEEAAAWIAEAYEVGMQRWEPPAIPVRAMTLRRPRFASRPLPTARRSRAQRPEPARRRPVSID